MADGLDFGGTTDLNLGDWATMQDLNGLDPNWFSLTNDVVGAGGIGGDAGLLFDTLTGQYVTPDQAMALAPNEFNPQWAGIPTAGNGDLYAGQGNLPTPAAGAPGMGGGGLGLNDWLKLGSAALGLGTAGLGAAGIAQGLSGGSRPGTSSTGTRSDTQAETGMRVETPGPMGPEQQYLYGGAGGPDIGGLVGGANLSLYQNTNPSGLMNLQAGTLSNAAMQAPIQDQYLKQQLLNNAYGMSRGGLPSLTPELQNQINSIYGSQWNNINRYLEDYLTNVRDQMNNMGWEGNQWDVLRQGPGQALFAPGIREATRQQGLLAGQAAQAGINLAQDLPMQAAKLGGTVFGQDIAANQNQQNIANAFNTPIALRNQLPLGMFQTLNQNRGGTVMSTGNTTGNIQTQGQNRQPPMTLLDAFAPAAQILGGIGGLAGGLQNMGQPGQAGVSY